MKQIRISDVIEQLDLTPHQWHTIYFTWWLWISVGWVLTLVVYMMDAAGESKSDWTRLTAAEHRLTVHDKSLTILIGGAAAIVTSPIIGSLSDVLGRMPSTEICMVLGTFVTIGFGLARSKLVLMVVFCLNATGGACSITQSLLAEWLPVRWRGIFTVSLHAFWNVGRFAVTGLWIVLPPNQHWTEFFLVASIPVVILVIYMRARGWRYESPRWLAVRGNMDGCIRVLSLLATSSGGSEELPSGWDDPNALSLEDDAGQAVQVEEHPIKQQLAELTDPDKQRLLVLLGVIGLAVHYASMSLFFWAMEYFKMIDLRAAVVPVMVAAPLGKIASNVLVIVGGPGACLIDRYARVPLMQVGYFGFGICISLLCTVKSIIGLAAIMFFAMVFEELIWTVGSIYMMELFPTTVRNTALGVIGGLGHIGGIVGTALCGPLMERWVYLPMVLMSSFLFCGGVVCCLLTEDRSHKTLSDTIGYGSLKA